MTETHSKRIDTRTKKRSDALSKQWMFREIQTALVELDAGRGVSHEKVSKWLRSWGKPGEKKAPRG